MTITLIGMPGAGKSTVGVVLAKTLRCDFIDADLVIQRQTGARLPVLIERLGTEGFIELENRICCGIEAENTVIATGGSAVYGAEAMAHFAAMGPVVYLRISEEALTPRLGDLTGRGVVMRTGGGLHALYAERAPLYEAAATHVVDMDGKDLAAVVREIAVLPTHL